MSTQEKQHMSICHIISQNKTMTMENLAKLSERTVQTYVKVVRHIGLVDEDIIGLNFPWSLFYFEKRCGKLMCGVFLEWT
jgi:predicted transcriptional regulator